MGTRILTDDNYLQIAHKIFYEFDVLQSCRIDGWLEITGLDGKIVGTKPKGEWVLEQLKILDDSENIAIRPGDGRKRRKRVVLPNTIGGYVAHKIFGFKEEIINAVPKISIWRIQ